MLHMVAQEWHSNDPICYGLACYFKSQKLKAHPSDKDSYFTQSIDISSFPPLIINRSTMLHGIMPFLDHSEHCFHVISRRDWGQTPLPLFVCAALSIVLGFLSVQMGCYSIRSVMCVCTVVYRLSFLFLSFFSPSSFLTLNGLFGIIVTVTC